MSTYDSATGVYKACRNCAYCVWKGAYWCPEHSKWVDEFHECGKWKWNGTSS